MRLVCLKLTDLLKVALNDLCGLLEPAQYELILPGVRRAKRDAEIGTEGRTVVVVDVSGPRRPEVPNALDDALLLLVRRRQDSADAILEIYDLREDRHFAQLDLEHAAEILKLIDRQDQADRRAQSYQAVLHEKNQQIAVLNESVFRFVDGMSHEFRSPITVVKEFCSLLQEGLAGPLNAKQAEFLEAVHGRNDELALLVDDFVDISRCHMGTLVIQRKHVDFTPWVEEAVHKLRRRAESKGVALHLKMDGDLPQIFADPERLGRAVYNLVQNAIKFTDEGGVVSVQVAPSTNGDSLTLVIRDSTASISCDELEEVVEFFRRTPVGLQSETGQLFGPGLGIARDLIRYNLGEFTIGTDNQQSYIRVDLPTGTPRLLAARFLALLDDAPEAAGLVHLLRYRGRITGGLDPSPLIDDFLQQQQGRMDFVYPVEGGTWVMLLCGDQSHFEDAMDRMESHWEMICQQGPITGIAPLTVERIGGWDRRSDAESIIRCFEREADVTAGGCERELRLVGEPG